MTQPPTKGSSRERQKINVSDGWELHYWTRQLRCTEQELRAAISVAGPEIAAVRDYLQAKRPRRDDGLARA